MLTWALTLRQSVNFPRPQVETRPQNTRSSAYDSDERRSTRGTHTLRQLLHSWLNLATSGWKLLAKTPATVDKVDINTLLERPASASSRGNGSTTSYQSTGEDNSLGPTSAATTSTTSTTPAALRGPPLEPQYTQRHYPIMQTAHYQPPYPHAGPPNGYPPMHAYPGYPPAAMADPRLPPPIPFSHHLGPSNKRLAPVQPHPAESPAKKKQSKWTAEEDASIIELRGELPREAVRVGRGEEEQARPFKKDMWEKIAKEMQLPWRAAEAMHWQIGEVEMAQRANVPVFHLAGGGNASGPPPPGMLPEVRTSSITPPSDPPPAAAAAAAAAAYTHTHNHSLPQAPPQPMSQPLSPIQSRLRRNSDDEHAALRHRADSARPLETSAGPPRTLLPPLGEVTGHHSHKRYTLPPVITSAELRRDYR
ncbi:hypothetical protein KC367_g61 [Hortaea werneckii]|nr:hypothetical protein KC367_g61 [Hortaea werneckii]